MSNVNLIESGPPPSRVDETEWALRAKLAACYRIFDHLGWTMVIFNHITCRLPGDDHHFLINPYGLRYDEVTASNLVKIDLEGNVVDDSGSHVNYAGFIIHAAIHANVPEACWIMHTHTPEGIAVSCKQGGLANTNFYTAMLGDHIAYHDFEGLTHRPDEQHRLVASIGDKAVVILRNHGLLTHGRTAEEAFNRLYVLQLACETQLLSQSMAGPDIPVSEEATRYSVRDSDLFGAPDPSRGKGLFDALERIVAGRGTPYQS